ncbi:MAG: hypothetical protein KC729_15645, partial [Candidatus Eisenbacteria bacterium]|nr:hypothetical protein [Candidatus Eisenbacteria bacterium]
MRATAPFRKPLDTSLFQVLLTTVPCLLLFGSVWHSAEAGMLGISLNTTGTLYDIDEGDGTASNPRIVGDKIDMIAMSTSGVLYGVS